MAGGQGQMRICPTCKGKGWKMSQKKRVIGNPKKGGRVETVTEQEACPQCGWSGWAPA